MKYLKSVVSLFLFLPTIAHAQGADRLTLLEGSLRVMRGTVVYKASEGMLLRQGDILESSEGGFAQLEFAGGTIVALGPSSKVYLFRLGAGHPGGGQTAANLVLLSGWLKGESNPASGTYRYSTPVLTLAMGNGAVVLHLDADGCDANFEEGSAAVGETYMDGGWRQTGTAKAGQFLSRRGGKGLATFPRPSSAFVQSMPIAFRDTLPPRLPHFEGKKPTEPKADHAVTFAELQPWLALPMVWRRDFVERFEPRLADPDFRAQLEAHVPQYPEWDPILHPEKYPTANPSQPNKAENPQ